MARRIMGCLLLRELLFEAAFCEFVTIRRSEGTIMHTVLCRCANRWEIINESTHVDGCLQLGSRVGKNFHQQEVCLNWKIANGACLL